MRPAGVLAAGLLLLLCLSFPVFPQDLYWEEPEILVPSGGRFPQAESGGDVMALLWQEAVAREEGRGDIYLSMKTSVDGETWIENRRFAGPYPYYGNENSIFSLAMDSDGGIFVAALAGENTIEIFSSADQGRTFLKSFTKTTLKTTLAPRLFRKEEGGFLLFVTQERNDILSVFSAISSDGVSWSEMVPLAPEAEITLSFLPNHVSHQGREYVVFQALRTGEGGAYQLYLKISEDGGMTWGPLRLLTGFEEVVDGTTPVPSLFDNQRPQIRPINGNLAVVWERKYGRNTKQIYYMELDEAGALAGNPEQVTRGIRSSNFPQIILYRGTLYLLWFDNRRGDDHIILAYKNGVFWEERDLSPMAGVSTFGRPVLQNDNLYVFWENRRGDSSRLYILRPDTTAVEPAITPVNFIAGRRSRNDVARFRWSVPRDSSGIAGFTYAWSRDEVPDLPERLMVLENVRSAEFAAPEDGAWYFHIASQDYAGNWSSPVTMEFYRDRTPPGPVVFNRPEKDELGFLVSNTFSISWQPPDDEDVAGFTYRFQYAGETRDTLRSRNISLAEPPRTVIARTPEVSFRNSDDGLWAMTVAAIDTVGNVGPAETLLVHLNKYLPVTYISFVSASKDETGTINLDIIGRGFSVDGTVSQVIIDRDGREPFDYVFTRGDGAYTVRNDRSIAGPSITDFNDGSYFVGVRHPLRGLAFAGSSLRLESSGTIKFGDFNVYYEPQWKPVKRAPLMLTGETLMIWSIVVFLALVMLFSVYRIGELAHEGRRLRLEAIALVTGDSEHWAKKQERIRAMKKKGIGLRLKFTLFITVLVISVVLMVSVPLGFYMTANQERNLAEGLQQRVSVLLESLAAGARSYLPGGNTLELGILPSQISAMSEALFTTITGRSQADAASYGSVWASNDVDIAGKIDTAEIIPGVSRITDEISAAEAALAEGINGRARASISDIARELDGLAEEGRRLAVRTDRASQDRLRDIQNTSRALETRMNEQLSLLASTIYSVPDFRIERPDYSGQVWFRRILGEARNLFRAKYLDPDTTLYTFYKPVLYRTRGVDVYYRGLVRLGVSTEAIIEELGESRENLIKITGIVTLIALLVGIFGALVLASITIIPIRRLVHGVEKIRDTEDKESLKDHVIDVKTHDEIAQLAETINQMTQGLAKAAAASKDLTVGKEIQKMFIPLEVGPGGRKLTSGKTDTPNAEFFGYYEGAKGVSGDYFDFRQLDGDNYAFIKCDVAGKGVPAALIMVQVATVFISYFKDWDPKRGLNMVPLLYKINDIVESQGFKGRFAAMTLGVINTKTGISQVTHAGDRILNFYDSAKRSFTTRMMNDCPATGVFPNFMLEMKTPYEQIQVPMKPGDINMLFTDGVEEAHRKLRKPNFDILQLPPEKEGDESIEDEMLGNDRIKLIIEAAMNRRSYRLEKLHNPLAGEDLVFDFSDLEPTAENAVMAMVSVEKIFRTVPNPRSGAENRIMIDKKVDEFLKKTFSGYGRYYGRPLDNPNPGDFPNYNFYTHLMEDDQYDDLTLLAIRKK